MLYFSLIKKSSEVVCLSPRPTAAEIPIFITGHPVITKWDDYSTSNIPTVVSKDIQVGMLNVL